MADMSDSPAYTNLTDKSLALSYNGKPVAIPYVMETYGIIYNKTILNKYFALPDAAIKSVPTNFDQLKQLADGLQKDAKQLGIKGAFTSAGFDPSSNWRYDTHMANIPLFYEFKDDNVTSQPSSVKGTYLDGMKNLFDLYIKDSTTNPQLLGSKTGSDADAEFASGQAAMYQNGTWGWADETAKMDPSTVGMFPIYIGAPDESNYGLATGSENYWCINKNASAADQKATNDFLKWVITSKDGINALTQTMGFVTPFKTTANVKSNNPLVQAAIDDQASGKKSVSWLGMNVMPDQTWKDNLGNALLAYAKGGSWDGVTKAFVDGWATEYTTTNG
jgi:raffinose/stachyose/melibiose transport system substrate-binding protein